jgi:hypothetical protein
MNSLHHQQLMPKKANEKQDIPKPLNVAVNVTAILAAKGFEPLPPKRLVP